MDEKKQPQPMAQANVMIVLDIDDTLINAQIEKSIQWNGNKASWIKAFEEIQKEAEKQKINLLFCVLSAKSHFDDLSTEVALELKGFLSTTTEYFEGTKSTGFIKIPNLHMVFKINKELKTTTLLVPYLEHPLPKNTNKKSGFRLVRPAEINVTKEQIAKMKATELKQLGEDYDVEHTHIIFIDDQRANLEAAKAIGVQTLSSESLNHSTSTQTPPTALPTILLLHKLREMCAKTFEALKKHNKKDVLSLVLRF